MFQSSLRKICRHTLGIEASATTRCLPARRQPKNEGPTQDEDTLRPVDRVERSRPTEPRPLPRGGATQSTESACPDSRSREPLLTVLVGVLPFQRRAWSGSTSSCSPNRRRAFHVSRERAPRWEPFGFNLARSYRPRIRLVASIRAAVSRLRARKIAVLEH
jgi:hypothetical protein